MQLTANEKPTAPGHIWNAYDGARKCDEGRSVLATNNITCAMLRNWHQYPERHAEIGTTLARFNRHV